MQAKALEVRDRATFIPIVALAMSAANEEQRYLMSRVGFNGDGSQVIVMQMNDQRASSDPYDWSRTMRVAHEYILRHFDELTDGEVIDVEYLLGESKQKRISERFGEML